MPSRKHYLLKHDDNTLFDHRAYMFLKDRIGSRVLNMSLDHPDRKTVLAAYKKLPISFRKGFATAMALAKIVNVNNKCREFRLPRNLSRRRNPILQAQHIWR